jgi:hypothetical protein
MQGQHTNLSSDGHISDNFRRGPEVESWFGAEEGSDPAIENEWLLLPFMALSDGAHVYVSLLYSAEEFGIAE